jgi:hypothetical protein
MKYTPSAMTPLRQRKDLESAIPDIRCVEPILNKE